jgi:hypothetical protein
MPGSGGEPGISMGSSCPVGQPFASMTFSVDVTLVDPRISPTTLCPSREPAYKGWTPGFGMRSRLMCCELEFKAQTTGLLPQVSKP